MARRRKNGRYKSNWEVQVAEELLKLGIDPIYEQDTIRYVIPEKEHKYKPDFKIRDNVYIESKGIWDAEDRKKILLVKQQHPHIRICMLFMNANMKIFKRSKTTYGDWCDKHGIEWSHKVIKKEWLKG